MKKKSCFLYFAFLLAAVVVITKMAPAALAAVMESEASGWSVSLDDTKQITLGDDSQVLTVLVSGAEESELTYQWSIESGKESVLKLGSETSNKTVALQPVGCGTAIVTVEVTKGSEQKTAACAVTIDYAAANSVTVSPKTKTIDQDGNGSSVELTASVSAYANPNDVTWSLNRPDVINLSATSGKSVTATALRPGEATVTARALSGDVTDAATIIVRGVALSKGALELYVGRSETLTATAYGGIGTAAEWESGNNSIAFVSANGTVTGQSVGKTVITVSVSGYEAKCEVIVKENTANNIDVGRVSAGQPYSFSAVRSDLNSRCITVLGTSLSYVSNLSVATNQGTLYYNYVSADDPGYGVGSTEKYYYSDSVLGQRSISDVVFVPSPEFNGEAKVRYSGYDTGNRFFTGAITFHVEESAYISYSVRSGESVAFDAADFNAVCRKNTGRDLRYITLQLPASSQGVLYYNYVGTGIYAERVEAGTQYGRIQNPYLGNVSFIPAEGYTGSVRIGYTGVDTAGNSFAGRIVIAVSGRNESDYGDLTYTTARTKPITFRSADFNTLCRNVMGKYLDYIRFKLPPSSDGTLYYDYKSASNYGSKVSANTRYYRTGGRTISDVTFVPGANAGNTVFIDFTAYDEDGYGFDGRVVVRITGSGEYGDVQYNGASGRVIKFFSDDFNDVCLDVNGTTLRYVTFELPASSQGVLYYDYSSGSRVSSSTRYYRSGSPSISSVVFVPSNGYSGTVNIGFTGYDVDGNRFGGTVVVSVEGTGVQQLRYTVASTGVLSLDSTAFHSICQDMTGKSLDYIRFDLPSSNRGTLYYKYDVAKGTYSSRVSAGTNYYRTGKSLIDDVSFVPSPRFTGTVTLGYTGRNISGEPFDGTVEVEVVSPVGTTIRYTGSSLPVELRSKDLYDVSRSLMGRDLVSIQITELPPSSAGFLYMNYAGPLNTGTKVSTDATYSYTASPRIDQISFVPKADYQGTIVIPYRATDIAGKQFTGNIELVIASGYSVSHFTDMENSSWAKPSVEFLRKYGIIAGYPNGAYGPNQNIRRGDFVLMLCRAFNLYAESTPNYPDVPRDSYYAGAIAAATERGIVAGYSDGRFGPNDSLTRQDAMVMIARTMDAVGRGLPHASVSILSVFSDSGQTSDYAKAAVAALVQAGAVNGNGGRLMPKTGISRAEMAVILHRVLTL